MSDNVDGPSPSGGVCVGGGGCYVAQQGAPKADKGELKAPSELAHRETQAMPGKMLSIALRPYYG